MFISRRKFEEKIEQAEQNARIEEWNKHRLNELECDVCELREHVEELTKRIEKLEEANN